MEIETKFKVGDCIYVVDKLCDYRVIRIRVSEIIITAKDIYYVDYENIAPNGYECERYNEQDCFASKEEAQKECERRNECK